MLEQVQLVIDESAVELPDAIGMPEKVRARVREIVAGAIRDIVRDFDLFHLIAIDGVGTEIARYCGHDLDYFRNGGLGIRQD